MNRLLLQFISTKHNITLMIINFSINHANQLILLLRKIWTKIRSMTFSAKMIMLDRYTYTSTYFVRTLAIDPKRGDNVSELFLSLMIHYFINIVCILIY